jgi:hypothetical protein
LQYLQLEQALQSDAPKQVASGLQQFASAVCEHDDRQADKEKRIIRNVVDREFEFIGNFIGTKVRLKLGHYKSWL